MTVEAAGYITKIRIRNEAMDTDVEIGLRSDEELKELSVATSRYFMTRPVESNCNDTLVEDKLINVAAAISITGVVEDEPEDLSKYGLDEPLDIWMTNTDGDEVHYLIGDGSGTSVLQWSKAPTQCFLLTCSRLHCAKSTI